MTPQARMFLAMLHDGADGHGSSLAGVPHGHWRFLAEGSLRAEGTLDHGAPHGTWRVWDRDGRLRSESGWDRGVPSGRWVTWDAQGKLERVDVKGEDRLDASSCSLGIVAADRQLQGPT